MLYHANQLSISSPGKRRVHAARDSVSLRSLRWCYTGRFATTIFSATPRCNVGTVLRPFETMSQQCCNDVLKNRRCESSRVRSPLRVPLALDLSRYFSKRKLARRLGMAKWTKYCRETLTNDFIQIVLYLTCIITLWSIKSNLEGHLISKNPIISQMQFNFFQIVWHVTK